MRSNPSTALEAGKKLASLLREHIQIATDVVKAAKTGTKAELAAAQKKWSSNGRDIAAFLSEVNPRWSSVKWRKRFRSIWIWPPDEVVGPAQAGLGCGHPLLR
jgi:hypothetical protein